jgi:microsomal dipeptidase-like Zn-dependent dipeptidase
LNIEPYNRIESLAVDVAAKYDLPNNWRESIDVDSKNGKKIFTEYREKLSKLRNSLPEINVKTFVDHVDHVIKITGSTDHVALGSDFDGIGQTPVGLEDVSKMPAITDELFKRGYQEKDIRKILGGNFLRVFKKVCSK